MSYHPPLSTALRMIQPAEYKFFCVCFLLPILSSCGLTSKGGRRVWLLRFLVTVKIYRKAPGLSAWIHLMMKTTRENECAPKQYEWLSVHALTTNFISLASQFHQQCDWVVKIIVITPGTSAFSKGMCIKHVGDRGRRADCFEEDLLWEDRWKALNVIREKTRRSACGWKGICQPKIRFQVVYSGCLLLFTQMLLFNFTGLRASD